MRRGGRIVNVSSQSGQLRYFSDDLRQSFLGEDLSLLQLAETVHQHRVRLYPQALSLVMGSGPLPAKKLPHR